MAKFRRDDRVKITNQHSQFRNVLGTVIGYKDALVMVRLDGSGRYVPNPPLFDEQDLGTTSFEEPCRPVSLDEYKIVEG